MNKNLENILNQRWNDRNEERLKKMEDKRLRKLKKDIHNQLSELETELKTEEKILVHGAMKYRCKKCGSEWYMFLEKGIEEFGENHKPSPFTIMCPCGGAAFDVSGIIKLPESGYKPLPEGESYFANKPDSDCGVPVLSEKLEMSIKTSLEFAKLLKEQFKY